MESKLTKKENYIFNTFDNCIRQNYDESDQNFMIENLICELDEIRYSFLELLNEYRMSIKLLKNMKKCCFNIDVEKYEYTNGSWRQK